MARIYTEPQSSGKIYLVCMLEPGDVLDTVTRNMYEQNHLKGLLTAYYTQEEAQEFFRSDVSGCIPLSRYLRDAHGKKDVLGVFRGIAEAIREADDYMIPRNELGLDMDRIYLDLQTNRVRLLCLPLLSDAAPERLQSFFKRLCSDITLPQSEDSAFLFRIQTYLNQHPVLETEDFLHRLQEIGFGGGLTDSHASAASEAGADASLVSDSGAVSPVTGECFRIGRAGDNDLCLDDMHIGGHHAVIERGSSGYVLRDLNSKNRTYLNGRQLPPDEPTPLHDGDAIRFYKLSFTFRRKSADGDGGTVVEASPAEKPVVGIPKPGIPKKPESSGKNPLGGLGGLFGGKAQPAPPVPAPQPPAQEAKNGGKKIWEKLKPEKKPAAEPVPAPKQSASPFAGLKIPGMGQEELAGVAAPAVPATPAPAKKPPAPPAIPIVSTDAKPAPVYTSVAGGRTVILDDAQSEDTVVLDTLHDAPEFAPTLVRSVSGERIPVTKQVFRLGRNPETSDYCIADGHISSIHAYIELHDSCAYLVDLNSSNHTYLNGQKLEPKQGYRLRHGDKIALYQEAFVYYEHA